MTHTRGSPLGVEDKSVRGECGGEVRRGNKKSALRSHVVKKEAQEQGSAFLYFFVVDVCAVIVAIVMG